MITTIQLETLERIAQQRKMLGLEVAAVYALIKEIKEFLEEALMTNQRHPITPPPTMTELSPAAIAVLDAAERQTDLDFRYAPMIAAAALRAVVEQLGFELQLDDLSGTVLYVVSANPILAIANELEQFND